MFDPQTDTYTTDRVHLSRTSLSAIPPEIESQLIDISNQYLNGDEDDPIESLAWFDVRGENNQPMSNYLAEELQVKSIHMVAVLGALVTNDIPKTAIFDSYLTSMVGFSSCAPGSDFAYTQLRIEIDDKVFDQLFLCKCCAQYGGKPHFIIGSDLINLSDHMAPVVEMMRL